MSESVPIVRIMLLAVVLPLVVRASDPSSDVCAVTADNANLVPISCGEVITKSVPALLTTNAAEQQKTIQCMGADPSGNKALWWKLDIPPGQWNVTMTLTVREGTFHAFVSGSCLTATEDLCGSAIVSQMGGKWQDNPWSASWESLSMGTYLLPIVFSDHEPGIIHVAGDYTVKVSCTPWQPPAQMGACFPADENGNAGSGYSTLGAIFTEGSEFPVDSFFRFSAAPQTTWTDQMAIPEGVSGFATWIGSDFNGAIVNSSRTLQAGSGGTGGGDELTAPALIWDEPTVGCYDMVVDMDNDGVYDAAHDVLVTSVDMGPAFCVTAPPPAIPTLSGAGTAVMGVLLLAAAAWVLPRQ